MNNRIRFTLLTTLAVFASAAIAQHTHSAAPTAAPTAAASAPMTECKTSMTRHDHGAERNAPAPAAMPCKPEAAASAANAGAPMAPMHDHGMAHKQQ